MSHNPQEILDTILNRMRTLATTETVVGQPVTVKDVTILPVIKMSVGFAAGGGEGKGGSDKSSSGAGMASGGGGGASINPVGFIAIEGDKIRFIGVGKGKIETLVESVPELLKKMGFKLKKDTTSDKKEDKAKQ